MLTRLTPGIVVAVFLALLSAYEPAPPPAAEAPRSVEAFPQRSPRDFREMDFFTAFADAEPKMPAITKTKMPPPAAEPAAGTATANPAASKPAAYASLALPGATGASGAPRAADTVPSGAPPPLDVLANPALSLPPARGLRVWTAAGISRAEQELFPTDTTAYSLTERKYSAGLDYDWSIDTTLGVSADILESTVKSRHPFDNRENRVRGLVGNARVDTVLMDTFLLGLEGFYGTLNTEGEGMIGAWNDNGATTRLFREDGHNSKIYGFSGRLSLPMLVGGVRAVAGGGIEFSRIDTENFNYGPVFQGSPSMTEKAASSSSLRFPVTFSMERDFVKSWGIVTPRLAGGYTYETSDTANGVRALGASSSSRLPYESYSGFDFLGGATPFFSLERSMFTFGAGLDIRTVGGWTLRADYRRDIAAAYSRDAFRLELGRNF